MDTRYVVLGLLIAVLAIGFSGRAWTQTPEPPAPAAQTATPANEPTYAERLGWPAGSKVVIFHIDDAGMCHDANVGISEAFEQGVSTSTSIMMPCGWVPEFAQYLKEHPETDAGVHLTLTSEWDNYRWFPVAGKAAVPGLCDPDGYLWDDVESVVKNAPPQEVERELRAQIDRALTMGIKPTHLDSHMGTLFEPLFVPTYIKVGIETGIPILLPGGHLQFIGEEAPEMRDQVRQIAKQVWDAGLPVIDDVVAATYDWSSLDEKKAKVYNVLRTMKPGITEIIQHCTRPSEIFASISSSSETRLNDLLVSIDPETKKIIQEEGIILTTWRELKQRRDQAAQAQPQPATQQ